MRRISERLAEQAFGRSGIAQAREHEVDRGTGGIDGSVEVAPPALDTNVGFIDTPGLVGWFEMTAQPLLQFGTVALDPAPDCRVVRFQAALAEQLFDIAERERIPKVPAHGAQNQLGLGLSPLKDRRSDCLLHDLFRLPAAVGQSCNTTDETYPYVILDARYEKVRLDGVIQSQAVFIAIGINGEGRRQILGVELSNRESRSSWTTFVTGLKTRGLDGVEFVVSDDHAGLKRAVRELLPEAVWQRCYVHFLRNALDYLPRKADDDCRQELRWLYDRRNLKEAQQDLQAWLTRWATRYPKLTDWVEAHIGETLNFYSLPRQHHKHLKSTNMLERLNEEIKRRTRVVRIFPNAASCLRLVRALCAETHEGWLEDPRYLNMEFLKEQKKELRTAA